jgi:hypothetical protein
MYSELADFGKIILAFIAGLTMILVLSVRCTSELSFPGEMAKIEQLRDDLSVTASTSNEDAIGQATQWNQTIKSNQRYRSLWWGRIVVANEWESVSVIDIPEATP